MVEDKEYGLRIWAHSAKGLGKCHDVGIKLS